jgi:hypothetical protein
MTVTALCNEMAPDTWSWCGRILFQACFLECGGGDPLSRFGSVSRRGIGVPVVNPGVNAHTGAIAKPVGGARAQQRTEGLQRPAQIETGQSSRGSDGPYPSCQGR